MDWRHHALCREQDPELFFPIGTTGPAAQQVDEAKAVCRRCDQFANSLWLGCLRSLNANHFNLRAIQSPGTHDRF